MEKNNVRKEFGRIKEASQVTGLSVSHIWQLIKENKIESYLPSPKIRLINFELQKLFRGIAVHAIQK